MKISKRDKKSLIIVSACFLAALVLVIVLSVIFLDKNSYEHNISVKDTDRGKAQLSGGVFNDTNDNLLNVEIEVVVSVKDSKGLEDEFIIIFNYPSIRENDKVFVNCNEKIMIGNIYKSDMVADKIESVRMKFTGQDDYVDVALRKSNSIRVVLFIFSYLALVVSYFIFVGVIVFKNRLESLSKELPSLAELSTKTEKTLPKKCANCGAMRGKNNSGKYCEYCGHNF